MGVPRILVVEDETVVARSVSRCLETAGYHVVARERSGKKAIQTAELMRPDLVLMDIVLQGEIDGIEAADWIRSRLNLPIVYLTAYESKELVERAKLTDPYGYVSKPFSPNVLVRTIDIALYKSKADRKTRQQQAFLTHVLESLGHPFYVIDAENYHVIVGNSASGIENSSGDATCYALVYGRADGATDRIFLAL